MNLNEFIEKDMVEFINRNVTGAPQTETFVPRSEEYGIFDMQKDYKKRLKVALENNNLEDAKKVLMDLNERLSSPDVKAVAEKETLNRIYASCLSDLEKYKKDQKKINELLSGEGAQMITVFNVPSQPPSTKDVGVAAQYHRIVGSEGLAEGNVFRANFPSPHVQYGQMPPPYPYQYHPLPPKFMPKVRAAVAESLPVQQVAGKDQPVAGVAGAVPVSQEIIADKDKRIADGRVGAIQRLAQQVPFFYPESMNLDMDEKTAVSALLSFISKHRGAPSKRLLQALILKIKSLEKRVYDIEHGELTGAQDYYHIIPKKVKVSKHKLSAVEMELSSDGAGDFKRHLAAIRKLLKKIENNISDKDVLTAKANFMKASCLLYVIPDDIKEKDKFISQLNSLKNKINRTKAANTTTGLYKAALYYMLRNDFHKAILLFKKITELNPNNISAKIRLAECYRRKKMYEHIPSLKKFKRQHIVGVNA